MARLLQESELRVRLSQTGETTLSISTEASSKTMTRVAQRLSYRELFPDWRGRRPWSLYILENLLEVRAESLFTTNACGPDEDVNVYMAHLLDRHLHESIPAELHAEAGPLLCAPARLSGRALAHWWRTAGDHRLVCLGLYGRGDLVRRRRELWGMTEKDSRARDLADGVSCYDTAAGLLSKAEGRDSGPASLLFKLAGNFNEYVHVLQTLGSRRLGLGARITDTSLQRLLAQP